MRIRAADVASIMVLCGLAAQGAGLGMVFGAGIALAVVGTEIAVLGLVGVLNAR